MPPWSENRWPIRRVDRGACGVWACRKISDLTKKGKAHVVFKGGTALDKLFLKPPSRYSEDINHVQMKTGAKGVLLRWGKSLSPSTKEAV
ncbi:MAG: nucleotidyl transferase AbiEii/AbiGii toxin family protein [Ignavibacteriales bacterium]|nr:nucleotidyl transferase AbiEii/AbiGii toxin family protein [Ignavibacteriales bacterium]